MKQAGTSTKVKNKYFLLMVLCFLYGGYAIILFTTDIYAVFWRHESFTASLIPAPDDANRLAGTDLNHGFFGRPRMMDPFRSIASPISLSFLVSGLISISAGFALWGLIRDKEIKAIRQEAQDIFLLPEEKKIIDALKKSGYSSTQKKLASESGLNRVQVHRVLKKLEAKGLLEKHDFGMTNKIILKKEIFE